jgi:hypothetical protein
MSDIKRQMDIVLIMVEGKYNDIFVEMKGFIKGTCSTLVTKSCN